MARSRHIATALFTGAIALTAFMTACGSGRIDLYTCADPCGNGQPGTSCDDPCGDCRGDCVPLPPLGFDGPALLWTGPRNTAPECPDRAPALAYEGHADLDDSNQCPPCACAGPACVPPAGLTVSDQICPGGGTEIPIDAPADWSGACISPAMVPASSLASVTVEHVTESPCAPIPPEVPFDLGEPWGTFARACLGQVSGGLCRDPGMTCVPTADPPPPGFRMCIMSTWDEDPECPQTYPHKLAFFGGLSDTRECTPCECIQTAPSECVGWLWLYEDEACMAPAEAVMIGLGVDSPCTDIGASGVQLASMDIMWSTYEPGQCAASGGLPQGEAKPLDRRTFCCQGED